MQDTSTLTFRGPVTLRSCRFMSDVKIADVECEIRIGQSPHEGIVRIRCNRFSQMSDVEQLLIGEQRMSVLRSSCRPFYDNGYLELRVRRLPTAELRCSAPLRAAA